ncbi:hypothetical protein DFH08DRAFT_811191 [Mycena albidolilacea]|uniref:Uncharacterized protein n=1 Tax=Mycena albidolilacea TaxID=1033008 RepID=A0AAD7ENA6_9AGAR|nr:hypothetical protein DFH08DRAFT_811191 [Mycena albidolilacea]
MPMVPHPRFSFNSVQLPAASSQGDLSYAKENGCMQIKARLKLSSESQSHVVVLTASDCCSGQTVGANSQRINLTVFLEAPGFITKDERPAIRLTGLSREKNRSCCSGQTGGANSQRINLTVFLEAPGFITKDERPAIRLTGLSREKNRSCCSGQTGGANSQKIDLTVFLEAPGFNTKDADIRRRGGMLGRAVVQGQDGTVFLPSVRLTVLDGYGDDPY